MLCYRLLLIAGVFVSHSALADPTALPHILADEELAEVSGGTFNAAADGAGNMSFDFQKNTPSTGSISGSGTLGTNYGASNTNTLILQSGAQSNLRSVVNVNAVNSAIQVLLNLNINMNSQVGSIIQNNQAKH